MPANTPERFTLLEVLAVMFIMVLAGALVMGRLAKAPTSAALGEAAGRVDALYTFASAEAMVCNRTMIIEYDPAANTLEVVTPHELAEANYGEPTREAASVFEGTPVFSASDLPPASRGRVAHLPEACVLEFEPGLPDPEEVASGVSIAAVSDGDEAARQLVAKFFPDGRAWSRRCRLRLGGNVRYCEVGAVAPGLVITEEPPTPWREEEAE